MAFVGQVNVFTWEPDETYVYTGEMEAYGATKDDALHSGALHFLIMLTKMDVAHPHFAACDKPHGVG